MMFNKLEYDEQIKQLDALATQALTAFGLENANATLHAYTNNAAYQVVDNDPHYTSTATYALRIHRPKLKQTEWIQSELIWLSSLRRHTLLDVPEPAGPIYRGRLAGIDEPVNCTLLGWVNGTPVANPSELTRDQVENVGRFIAELHQHAQQFQPSENFVRPRLDWEGLFGKESPYFSLNEPAYYADSHHGVIARVADYVYNMLHRMDEIGGHFGMIHGDLVLKNILFTHDDGVGVIDFDDCAWGYYLYDLVPLLWACRNEANYTDIRHTLWTGYTSVLPQDEPETILETFLLARHYASCRWIAGNADHPTIRGKAHAIIASRMIDLANFFETGHI